MKYISILFVLCVLAQVAFGQVNVVSMTLISSSSCGTPYGYQNGTSANFTLPNAQNNGTGDHQLNVNNPITYHNGHIAMGCNGDVTQYQLDNGTWTSTYVGDDGVSRNTIDIQTDNHVNIRTVQTFQASLMSTLNGRNARLNITCTCGSTNLQVTILGALLAIALVML